MATCLLLNNRNQHDVFRLLHRWTGYEYISSNFYHIVDGYDGNTVLPAISYATFGDTKIAFVGITTPESFTKSTPAYFQDENGNYIYGIYGGSKGWALYDAVQAAIEEARY
ncbi:MAG: hypothetical protein II208_01290, partial [Alphaproteobacteria bacterium]|nr:hypothetical protein [Alphaproteobacteria bacterium]